MKLIIDTDPIDADYYAIWTDVPKAVNCTIVGSIGSPEDASIILKALQVKYERI